MGLGDFFLIYKRREGNFRGMLPVVTGKLVEIQHGAATVSGK
jgi:hypothetical protein